MRKRMTMLWIMAVLGLALVLPATTLGAARYRTNVLYNYCTMSGGANGFGWAELTVKAKEVGRSGTTYFYIQSGVEQQQGGVWYAYYQWPDEYSSWFPNNRASHVWTAYRYFDFTSDSQIYYHRIVITVYFYSDFGVLRYKDVFGMSC